MYNLMYSGRSAYTSLAKTRACDG